jgi:hypothetical protein
VGMAMVVVDEAAVVVRRGGGGDVDGGGVAMLMTRPHALSYIAMAMVPKPISGE